MRDKLEKEETKPKEIFDDKEERKKQKKRQLKNVDAEFKD